MRDLGSVYVDVGAGTTSIVIVREGGVTAYRSLTQGGNASDPRSCPGLEPALGRSGGAQAPTDRRDLLYRCRGCRGAGRLCRPLQAWATAVRTVLEELGADEKLPPFVYLCGGGSTLPGILEILQDIGQMAGSPFAHPPRIAPLSARDMGVSLDTHLPAPAPGDMMVLALARQALVTEAPGSTTDELLLRVSRAMGPG